jgi:hypothetical protein
MRVSARTTVQAPGKVVKSALLALRTGAEPFTHALKRDKILKLRKELALHQGDVRGGAG